MCLKGVYGWEPHNGTPSEVESKMIVTDVDGTKIPIFVDEEVNNVEGVKRGSDENRLSNVTVQLVLIRNE